jgi:hypothetical protein
MRENRKIEENNTKAQKSEPKKSVMNACIEIVLSWHQIISRILHTLCSSLFIKII